MLMLHHECILRGEPRRKFKGLITNCGLCLFFEMRKMNECAGAVRSISVYNPCRSRLKLRRSKDPSELRVGHASQRGTEARRMRQAKRLASAASTERRVLQARTSLPCSCSQRCRCGLPSGVALACVFIFSM